MRNHRRTTLAAAALAAGLLAACGGDPAPTGSSPTEPVPTSSPTASPSAEVPAAPQVPGMVVYASDADVEQTAERVRTALQEAGMVTATVDHAASAASVGEQLRPTTLVIGGAPPAGTPLLLEEQRVGVDLPQKYLAWEDEDGMVYLGYNSADYLAARAGIDLDSDALSALRMGSADVAEQASGGGEALSDGTEPVSSDDYLVEQTTDATVAEAIARYEQAFQSQELMQVATVDHAAGAATIGVDLRPTSVTIVGNPMVGTSLLQAAQTFGIDLPVRYVAWQDTENVVHVGHPDIRVLAERHGATGVEPVLSMVEQATATFTGMAAGN